MSKIKTKKVIYQDLEHRYQLLSDLINQIPDVVYFKDKKGKLILVNKAHAKGLKLEPEQVVGMTDYDLFPKKRADLMMRDDQHVIATGAPIIDKIERGTRVDGVDNYVSTTKIPRFDKKGNVVGLMGVTRDITRRVQLERFEKQKEKIEKQLKAAEELNKMKSELIAIVSHDFRTPLAVIKEVVLLLREQIAGPLNAKQQGFLEKAENKIVHLENLVSELLELSRIESGKFKLHYSLVDVNDLAKDSLDSFQSRAQQKNISLSCSLPKQPVHLFIDGEKTNRIITNLIDNAIKYTEAGGRVVLEVKSFSSVVRAGVLDTGIGITKQDQGGLFDKFVQLSQSVQESQKGVGLGLAIVKELVAKHGGTVWVESKAGIGAKFYFTLPKLFSFRAFDENIRARINELISKNQLAQLLNVVIVNYASFKKKIEVKSSDLMSGLGSIVDEIIRGYLGKTDSCFILTDVRKGVCSTVFPGRSEKDINEICRLLKSRIRDYFRQLAADDVFFNIGTISYPKKGNKQLSDIVAVNLQAKKIYLGSEQRRATRYRYKVGIEVVFPSYIEQSQTINISEGGLCFASAQVLKTDAPVAVKIMVPDMELPINFTARVAWIKSLPGSIPQNGKCCQIGLEIDSLQGRARKDYLKLIKTIGRKERIS